MSDRQANQDHSVKIHLLPYLIGDNISLIHKCNINLAEKPGVIQLTDLRQSEKSAYFLEFIFFALNPGRYALSSPCPEENLTCQKKSI